MIGNEWAFVLREERTWLADSIADIANIIPWHQIDLKELKKFDFAANGWDFVCHDNDGEEFRVITAKKTMELNTDSNIGDRG